MLTQTSGSSGSERYQEARRILYTMDLIKKVTAMNTKERAFVESMVKRIETYVEDTIIAPAALFWLRDLKDKYL